VFCWVLVVSFSLMLMFFYLIAPAASDQESLPQTMAFVTEVLRWRPVTAGGMYLLQ
jgi:hypothetical protein